MSKIDLSIIIVTYNVKDFLYNCIVSIYKSITKVNYEIIIIDNNSQDNSKNYILSKFDNINYIYNETNLGFSKANNQGFKVANGDFVLILNPDTLLNTDTLQKMYDFMLSNQDIGAAGCKVLNEDNSFQLACRRSFPNPWNSFCKLFGLQYLFPKLRLFSTYNLTYKNIDETYEVDALIGAFIFTRKDIITKIGGFSEEYFMYGEDLDFCHKIKDIDYKIVYFHEIEITHFKGESTKRSSINEVKHFYEAMEIFAKKYYGKSKLFLIFLKIGIFLRQIITYLKKYKSDISFIFTDTIVLLLAHYLSIKIRFDWYSGNPPDTFELFPGFLIIIYLISNFFSGVYYESNFSIKKLIRSHIFFFASTAVITYSFKEYDFSRIVLILLTGFSFIANYSIRMIVKNKSKNKLKNILYIGDDKQIINYFDSFSSNSLKYVGYLTDSIGSKNSIAKIDYADKIIKNKKINEIFISNNLKNVQHLKEKLLLQDNELIINIVEDLSEVIVSRNLNSAIGYDLANTKSKLSLPRFIIIKRFFDLLISIFLLTGGLLFIIIFFRNSKNRLKDLFEIFMGRKTLVGLYSTGNRNYEIGKEGMVSLASISLNKFDDIKSINKLNESYIKNYSPGLDFEIILKSIFK